MLTLFRAFAKSPMALIVIVLLVLAFALYGVGGIFTGSGTAVVVVGNQQVSVRDLSQSYEQTFRNQQLQNPSFTREQAREAGMGDQVLQRLIVQAAIYAKAQELGVVASNRALREEIRSYDAFNNLVTGEFDRDSYRQALQAQGYNERDFENTMREDIARIQLIQALTDGIATPADLSATRYLVQQERRRLRALFIDASTADAIDAPSDEELQAFIDANPNQVDGNGLPVFVAPEYRAITLVRFQVSDFERDVEVDETQLREVYDFQVDTGRLGTPATRTFTQLIAPDQETATAAVARLNAGETVDTVTAELNLGEPLVQEEVQAFEVPDTQLAEVVFSMQPGAIQTVEGAFGWYAIQVTGGEDAQVPSFEEQLPELRSEAARAEATNLMYDTMSAFENARVETGASLEDAAAAGGTFVEIFAPMDQYARDESGVIDFQRFSELAPDILRTAFEQVPGFPIDLQQYNENDFFTLRVDEVIPSRPRELAEVREEAERLWRAAQVDIQLEARAEEALAQLQAGDDMDFVAITSGGRVETTTLRRGENAGSFTSALVSQAFGQTPGEFALAIQHSPGEHAVLIVDEIIPGDVAAAELGEIGLLSDGISGEIENDIMVQLQNALLNEYGIDENSVDPTLRATALGENTQPIQ